MLFALFLLDINSSDSSRVLAAQSSHSPEGGGGSSQDSSQLKYFSVPMHEVARKDLYLRAKESGEITVAYAESGLDFRTDDYLTHADG